MSDECEHPDAQLVVGSHSVRCEACGGEWFHYRPGTLGEMFDRVLNESDEDPRQG